MLARNLAIFLALWWTTNCGAQFPEFSFQPIFCPVAISIGSEGISFKGSLQIATPLGVLAVDQKLASISDSAQTTHFVVRHLGKDHIYRIDRGGKIKLHVNGRSDISVSSVPDRSNVYLIEIEQKTGTVDLDFEPTYTGKTIAVFPLGTQSFELTSDRSIQWVGLTAWSRSLASVKSVHVRQITPGTNGVASVSVNFKDGISEQPWTTTVVRSGAVEFALDEFKKRLAELGQEDALRVELEELRVSTSPGTIDVALMSDGSLWQDAFMDHFVEGDAIRSLELEWGYLSNTMNIAYIDAAGKEASLAVSFAGAKNKEVLALAERFRELRPKARFENNGIR